MHMSDLQNKDIVSINDGKVIGRIIDALVDENGLVSYFVVEPKVFLGFIFSSSKDTTVYISQIKKIGKDVILVDL